MSMHWVLVADGSGARVFEGDALLEELGTVENLRRVRDSRLPGPGRVAADAERDPRGLAEERFARAVAQVVNHAEVRHRFERLVVVAPPRFLGDLRAELSPAARRRVVASVHHDWVRLSPHDIAERVRKHLPELAGLP